MQTSKFLERGSFISFLIIRTNEEGQIEHLTRSFHWSPIMMTEHGQKVPVTDAQQLRNGSFIHEKQFQDLFLPASIIYDPDQEQELRKACEGSDVTIFEAISTSGQPMNRFWAGLAVRRRLMAYPSG